MTKGANYTRIGIFVVGAGALVVGLLVALGGGQLLRNTWHFTTYFSAPVQGLKVGSPVLFRGVEIGEVARIQVFLDREKGEFFVPVQVNIYPVNFATGPGQAEPLPPEANRAGLDALIQMGLRAKLVPISLIAGTLGIEIGMFPNTPIRLAGEDPREMEIPTIPSTLDLLDTVGRRVLAILERVDMEWVAKRAGIVLDKSSQLLAMPETRQIIVETAQAMAEAQVVLKQLAAESAPLIADLKKTTATARTTLLRTQELLGDTRRLLDKGDLILNDAGRMLAAGAPLAEEMPATLRELGEMMRSVRSLLDALESSPDSVLFTGGDTDGER